MLTVATRGPAVREEVDKLALPLRVDVGPNMLGVTNSASILDAIGQDDESDEDGCPEVHAVEEDVLSLEKR